MSVKERLMLFLKHKRIGQAKFACIAGLSRGYVNSIVSGIGNSALHKIETAFPDLNTNWLLTGEGEMLTTDRDGHTIESDAIETTKLNDMNITRLLDTIERQGRQIDEMLEQNGRLISIIETLAGTSKQSRVG